MSENAENRVDSLIKDPKRVKPEFISSPNIDKLVSVVLRLAMENGVLRDRIERQEQLLKSKKLISVDDFKTYEPDAETVKRSQTDNFNLIRARAKDLG